jgi:hypothetical protein
MFHVYLGQISIHKIMRLFTADKRRDMVEANLIQATPSHNVVHIFFSKINVVHIKKIKNSNDVKFDQLF